jgi:hypothetical protein
VVEDLNMNKLMDMIFKPTNRRVRILVGAVLVGLGFVQITQSLATREQAVDKLVKLDEYSLVTGDAARLENIRTLAETDHLALLTMALKQFRQRGIPSYTCTFVKRERIRGKLGKEQHIDVKFREKPFSVAMQWTQNPPLGDALVFVEGKFKNARGRSQMVVRPASKFLRKLTGGSVLRLPDGRDALKSTLRPCTYFGFQNGLKSLIRVYAQARKNGDSTEKFGGFTEVDGQKCIVLIRFLPNRPGAKYPAKKTVVCLDLKTLLPLRVVGYDWDDKLSCNYEYRNVNFDVALQEADFTPKTNGIQRKAG